IRAIAPRTPMKGVILLLSIICRQFLVGLALGACRPSRESVSTILNVGLGPWMRAPPSYRCAEPLRPSPVGGSRRIDAASSDCTRRGEQSHAAKANLCSPRPLARCSCIVKGTPADSFRSGNHIAALYCTAASNTLESGPEIPAKGEFAHRSAIKTSSETEVFSKRFDVQRSLSVGSGKLGAASDRTMTKSGMVPGGGFEPPTR